MKPYKIVVLTGAGVSTDSGIPDFRSQSGVWSTSKKEQVITQSYLRWRPKLFWADYKEVFHEKLTGNHQPNTIHKLLSKLEHSNGVEKATILTQNIDGLHQDAGSKRVYEMHGTYKTAHCPKCKRVYDQKHIMKEIVPRCEKVNGKGRVCGFILEPDVVLFGDSIRHWKEAEEAVMEADICLIMGTTLQVKPFNLLPEIAKSHGAHLVFMNNEGTDFDEDMDEIYLGDIKNVLREYMKNF